MSKPSRWSRIVAWGDERERGTALALFRVLVGLTCLTTLFLLWWHQAPSAVWEQASDGGYRYNRVTEVLKQIGGLHKDALYTTFAIACVASVTTTIGLFGRLSTFVLLYCWMALSRTNPEASGSSDILITNALWLLTLGRSTVTHSLDCRLRTGRWTSDALVPAWPRRLGILQVVLVYFTTGLQKISVFWTPFGGFSALWFVLQQPAWARFDITGLLVHVYPLTQLGTATTWLWELSAPVLIVWAWSRRTVYRGGRLRAFMARYDLRSLYALVGLGVHGGIGLLMVVGPFSPITVSFYACLYTPDELARAWRWWQHRRRR